MTSHRCFSLRSSYCINLLSYSCILVSAYSCSFLNYVFCLSTIFFYSLTRLDWMDYIDLEGDDLFSALFSLLEMVSLGFYWGLWLINFCSSLLRLRVNAWYFSCMFFWRLSMILLTASKLIIVPISLFTFCLNYTHSFLSSFLILLSEISTIFNISY